MEYKDLPDTQTYLILECIGRDDAAQLKPGEWEELVRIASTDRDFRCVCLGFDATQDVGLMGALLSICRSVNARIACEYALA
jgi:hypothetical protein